MNQYERLEEQNPQTFAQIYRQMGDMINAPKQTDESQYINPNTNLKKPIFMVDDMEQTFISINQSLLYVGDNSTFQKRITWILVFQWISFSFIVNTIAFFFRSPNFSCRIPLTNIYYACSQAYACNAFDYKIIKNLDDQTSIVQEFQLYCERGELVYYAQTLFFLGGFISGFLFSFFSNRFGRRSVLLFVLIMSVVSIFLCSMATNFDLFTLFFFLVGFFFFGYEIQLYIYIGQISATRFKEWSIHMLSLVWAGSPIFLPLLRMIPTWRYTFMLFGLIWAVTLPFAYFCFLESPRFLLSKKCYKQVRQIFEKISVTNRRPPYKFKLIEEIEQENETFLLLKDEMQRSLMRHTHKGAQEQKLQQKQYTYLDLFRYPSIKKPTIVLIYLWMFRFFLYFGLFLALESVLQSGFLLSVAISISSISQVLGTFGVRNIYFILVCLAFCCKQAPNKLSIIKFCIIVISICCALLWGLEVSSDCHSLNGDIACLQAYAMIVLVVVIKFFNSLYFPSLISYSLDVYPTVVRSLGYGLSLTFGRLGTIIVPIYINYMRQRYPEKNSLCFLAPFGLLAWILCKIIPQVTELRETIKQEDEKKAKTEIQMKSLKREVSIRKDRMSG